MPNSWKIMNLEGLRIWLKKLSILSTLCGVLGDFFCSDITLSAGKRLDFIEIKSLMKKSVGRRQQWALKNYRAVTSISILSIFFCKTYWTYLVVNLPCFVDNCYNLIGLQKKYDLIWFILGVLIRLDQEGVSYPWIYSGRGLQEFTSLFLLKHSSWFRRFREIISFRCIGINYRRSSLMLGRKGRN